MFENVLLFAVSASASTIVALSSFLQRHLSSDFSVCYTFVLKINFITQQFLLVGVQGLVLFPGAGYPRLSLATLLATLTSF